MTTARRYFSPLRYPGGKATMAPWLAALVERTTPTLDLFDQSKATLAAA